MYKRQPKIRVPVNTSPNNKKAAMMGIIKDKRCAASVATIPTVAIARPRMIKTSGSKIPRAIIIPHAPPSVLIALTSGLSSTSVSKKATG